MRVPWRQLIRRQRGLRVALWALLLLTGNALQVVAANHWHSSAIAAAAGAISQPQAPANDGIDHDGCLLCQVAAHAGSAAPPPAPWALYSVLESRSASLLDRRVAESSPPASHAWQGRAPPLV